MIIFKKIKEYETVSGIQIINENSFLFFGSTFDERGTIITDYLKDKHKKNMKITYQNESDSFLIDDSNIANRIKIKNNLEEIINSGIKTIVLEATTLGYCELLLILYTINLFNTDNIKIKIYYAEPKEYKSKEDNIEYELSEEYGNHKYIKPFILPTPHDSTSDEQASLVSLLGFEENRLGRVINDSEDKYNQFISIFPIPGFKFGWENISLSKHYIFLDNKEDIYYAPADNPYETYKILNKITTNLQGKRIVIMPIGTKPCTIGAVIFLINKKEKERKSRIATKYDFPIKKKGRSSGIDKIYEYELFIKK